MQWPARKVKALEKLVSKANSTSGTSGACIVVNLPPLDSPRSRLSSANGLGHAYAVLRDLEETLLTIQDRSSREYMREAVRCYHAGAYRAAVVMAMAAAMDDLRRKLAAQAASGGAAQSVKEAAQHIEQLYKDQQAFESTLIDVCEQGANIFTPAEASKLRLLLKLRHLCAHPSGHEGTAEEAREVITSVIDFVLSRQALLGMIAVTALLERLEGPFFFPNPAQPADTVKGEIGQLQPSLYRALASKLTEKVLVAARDDSKRAILRRKPGIRENGARFLCGMVALTADARDAVWNYLGALLEADETALDALTILAADPRGISSAIPLTRERGIALARRHLKVSEARSVVREWVMASLLTKEEAAEIEALAAQVLLATLGPTSAQEVAELGWSSLVHGLLKKCAEDAGSSNFHLSNAAIDVMQGLPVDMAVQVTSQQRVQYLFGIAASSDRPVYYGYRAREVVEKGLGPRADFVDSLVGFARDEPSDMRECNVSWLHLARLLRSSARVDALVSVLAIFVSHEGKYYHATKAMLDECRSIAEVAEISQKLLDAGNAALAARSASLFTHPEASSGTKT